MKFVKKNSMMRTINKKLTATERRIKICYELYGIHATFSLIWAIFVMVPFVQSLPDNPTITQVLQYPILGAIPCLPVLIALMLWEDKLKKRWTSEQPITSGEGGKRE